MNVAVIGGNGQLGTDVARAFVDNGDEVVAVTHEDMEISNLDSVRRGLNYGPNVIVNTAAMHHVDKCEDDPQRAFAINGIGARNVALVSKELGATLIHVSTDYVFDGNATSPYVETAVPRPLNVYGNTKLAGEYFAQSSVGQHFVLRTSGLYGKSACRAKGRNFVDLMLHLAHERGEVSVVDSEWVTPTSTREIARQIVALSRSDAYGLYHATAEAGCSWYEFAREIFGVTNTHVTLKIAAPNAFPAKVPRPRFSILENHALKERGLNTFKTWQEGLREYLGIPVSLVREQV